MVGCTWAPLTNLSSSSSRFVSASFCRARKPCSADTLYRWAGERGSTDLPPGEELTDPPGCSCAISGTSLSCPFKEPSHLLRNAIVVSVGRGPDLFVFVSLSTCGLLISCKCGVLITAPVGCETKVSSCPKQVFRSYCPMGLTAIRLFLNGPGLWPCSDSRHLFIPKQVLRSHCLMGLTAICLFLKRSGLMAVCSDLRPLFIRKTSFAVLLPCGSYSHSFIPQRVWTYGRMLGLTALVYS